MSGNEVQERELIRDVIAHVIEMKTCSVSMIQRKFRIGYTKAARIIDQLEKDGIISAYDGAKPREVLVRSMPEIADPPKKKKPAKKAAPPKKKKVPKCDANTKSGKKCAKSAGWGTPHPGSGRCKLHGGSSTGPKTAEGKRKSAENAIKHGAYSDNILNDREQLLYDYLWDSTIEKHLLDRDDPMQMIPLQRACITYLKLIRLDEYEMEMKFEPYSMVKNPETGKEVPEEKQVFDLDGNILEDQMSHGKLIKLTWAKTPNWEGHFQRYMQMLGVDRGTKLKMDGMAGAAGQVVDAIGWLWGQKSQGDD